MRAFVNRLLVQGLSLLIRCYQYSLSYFWGRSCRFLPSCSDYALEAMRLHGAWCGGVLAYKRICRCRPNGASGYDPVPPSCQ